MKKTLVLLVFGLLTSYPMPTFAATWHVDGSVLASGDGLSRKGGFKTIQEGTGSAVDADTIFKRGWLESFGSYQWGTEMMRQRPED